MTRATATVLFTDLVGSTELRSQLGDQAAEALRRVHDGLLIGAVEATGGQVVKGLGDGIMATFTGAADAVAAAVAIQQALDRANRSGDRPAKPAALPASVAVRIPLDPELVRETATEFLLVHAAGGLAPLVERRCVEGGVAAVGAATEVGGHAVGMQLGVAFPAGAVHKGRHRQARRYPLMFSVHLLAGGARPPLQEIEGHRHGLDVGDRGCRAHLGAGERPAAKPPSARRT